MESQSSMYSLREVVHGLGEVPLKVKVIVKPKRGPYGGWLFEAGSSQQADDDLPWLYCGILYAYNVTHVMLFAPNVNNNNQGGRAFCIDSLSWTYGSSHADELSQAEGSVLTKVMAWKSSSFSAPDLDTQWRDISVEGSSKLLCFRDGFAYDIKRHKCVDGQFRFRGWKSLGEGPERFSFRLNSPIPDMSALFVNIRKWEPLWNYISVEVKALDGPNAGFIFPGIGQAHRNAYPNSTYGGVMFGANKRLVIWGFSQLGSGVCLSEENCLVSCLMESDCVGVISCTDPDQCRMMDLNVVNKRLTDGVLGTEGETVLINRWCN
ncbi:hypothetical protein LSH36_127g11019 [Paralvinella palmiformis]|uniref:Uncharacterized protein n=1 Tax=Paralvinella palmiformis TaxID=53620 RepID=A0AAD9JWX7_9ANNE|nr:hypothetical protein LSH36_127g11019 [Paralvinella palmiformis]